MSQATRPGQFYDDLSPAAQRLARIPRIGRLIGFMPPERAKKLSRSATEADVFWEVYTYDTIDGRGDCGLLADGLKTEGARRLAYRLNQDPPTSFRDHQIRRACDLLGAIAFELLARTDSSGKPQPGFDGVRENLKGFKAAVQRRFCSAGALAGSTGVAEDPDYFFHDWDALLTMDSHGLKHFLFSTDVRDQQLRWTDVTTMAFFAACWACRWATAPDRTMMTRGWVLDPWEETNEVFREFWMFAAHLPAEAIDRGRWTALFAPLYDGTLHDGDGLPIRSNEFLYRSWDRMERWQSPAVPTFLAEFRAIAAGQEGAEKRKIAEKMLDGFIPLVGSGKPGDSGTFTMGAPADECPDWDGRGSQQDNPLHKVTLSPFRLHRFCVTNLEYELFDPRHKNQRWLGGKHPSVKKARDSSKDDRCPVVMVSWYDAWCIGKWLGVVPLGGKFCRIVLPTEGQWEYACRAGRTTPFTFHEGHDGQTCTPDVCNFNGNYPFPEGTKVRKDKSTTIYRQATLAVDALKGNPWGFWQMHGNVWEWCEDWYSIGFYETEKGNKKDPVNDDAASARVLRGGCWLSGGGLCRSAARLRLEPGSRHRDFGFRLAAVPVVGAEPVKQGSGA